MKPLQITLDEEGLPESAVMELTRDELAWIASITGKLSANKNIQAFNHNEAGKASSGLYDGATEVINRYWDNGHFDIYPDALGLRVEIRHYSEKDT